VLKNSKLSSCLHTLPAAASMCKANTLARGCLNPSFFSPSPSLPLPLLLPPLRGCRIRRAREREKGLRERLEGDDISHLLAAQRAQAESLRKENDKLRQEVKELQSDREGLESVRTLTRQLHESESERERLTVELNAEKQQTKTLREQQEPLRKMGEQWRAQAEASTKSAAELDRKVKNLTAQLQAASGDLDEAAQYELNRQQEVEKLKVEIEMQQMDIVSLQKQLSDAVAEDSALRMEKEEEIEKMHVRMVSK
jgi:cell division protein FtsB